MAPKPKLPRVNYLKPRTMSVVEDASGASCLPAMISMLNCWASYSEGAPQCTNFVEDLKICMAKRNTGEVKREWHDFTKYLAKVNPKPHD